MVHTAFMRFPIDVIFVSREGRVLRIVHDLGPWRIAASFRRLRHRRARRRRARLRDVAVGDHLYLEGSAGAGFTAGGAAVVEPWRVTGKTAASPARCGFVSCHAFVNGLRGYVSAESLAMVAPR